MKSVEWSFNGESVSDELDECVYGFIYEITYTDGTKYIGKKNRFKDVRLKPRRTDRANAKRIVRKESDWRRYEGSTKLSKGKVIETKEIIRLCETKTDLTYWEMHYLFTSRVLFDDTYLNQNINRMFFPSERLTYSKEYIKGE